MARAAGELPSGMVTFVFTDIVGSTRLFHDLGDRFVDVLRRHREILQGAWATHGGAVVSAEGDEFFVAFADAGDALAACVDAQQALADTAWPEGVDLRVRAGVHRGLASPHEGNYVALAVHQAKRVADAAHGEQILVSQSASEGAPPDLPFGLRPLGRFRLRGFPEPVRLHQVVAEGLADGFAAVRALPSGGHNIVLRPTETIGRGEAIAAVSGQVLPRRTVTLTGPGGVGKSRLAAEVGVAIAPRWEDGVWFVDLSGVGEAELVAGAVATAVGAPAHPGQARGDDVLHHLAARSAVVLLDNCEHVVSACSDLITRIYTECPGVGVIATSREPLRVAGETLRPVEPLGVPDSAQPEPAEVLASDAGRLFWERGTAVRPGFVVDEENASAVAQICHHLDGLPLLIELAAAHVSAQSPSEILAGLKSRDRLLRSPDRSLAARHRTVEGLLDWSYRLLDPGEQAALRRLSVFATSFSREAASAAVSGDGIDQRDAHLLVWSLVDRSLITADVAAAGTRYRLLETIRDYARRHLDDRGETGEVAAGLAESYLMRVGPWLPADRAWIEEVDTEVDNLRALVPLLSTGHEEVAQQIACSIGWYHDVRQTFRDGIEELSRFADSLTHPSSSRVALLTTLGWLLLRMERLDEAQELAGSAAALRRECGAPDWDDVGVERIRGEITRRVGDPHGAIEIARETLRRDLSERGRGRMYNLLGTTSATIEDYDTAYEGCRQELEIYQDLGYEGMVAGAHGNLAEVALRKGDMPAAARHQRDCLRLAVEQGSTVMVAFSLIVAARVAAWRDQWATATSLHARAETLLDEIGLVLYDDDKRRSEDFLIDARERLGHEEFGEAHSDGREMPIAEAVKAAEEALGAPS